MAQGLLDSAVNRAYFALFQAAICALERRGIRTYSNAGLCAYDISVSLLPREVAYFVPENPKRRNGLLPSTLVTQTEDVLVDARGYIYITDKNHGLIILRETATPASLSAS